MEPLNAELPTQTPTPKSGGTGPVVAIVVIVIILALGGIYYLTQSVKQVNENQATDPDQQTIEALMQQNSDDTAAAIQADLDSTDFTPVDQSLQEVDASVKAE